MFQHKLIENYKIVFLVAALFYCLPLQPIQAGNAFIWEAGDGYRRAKLEVPATGKTGFTLLSPEQTGINFTNTLDERAGEANRVLFNGSGVAVGDFDNDGWPDLYLCSLNGRNALFKNLGGMKFKDVTQESGIVCTNRFCRGAVFADVNGDGNLDLLVATTGNGVFCFLNDGHGRFSDATRAAGTESKYGSVTLALADIDGNGTLDLYVADNRTEDIRDRGQIDIQMVNGKLTIPPWFKDRLLVVNGKVLEYGEPDILYLNDGRGHFTPASWTDGTFLDEAGRRLSGPPLDWGLTVTFRDLNGDGYPDLYVCNDYWTPDRIWINDGKGHFRALDKVALRNTSASSMGVDVADIGRTGSMDVFVVDMLSRDWRLRKRQMFAQTARELPIGAIDNRPQIMRNTLFHDCGDGTYAEVANYSGVTASDWSWSPVFLDVDLDGFEDLLITTGHVRDVQDLDADQQIKARQRPGNAMADPKGRREAFVQEKMENSRFYPRLDMPIVAFHNERNLRFEETTRLWGTDDPGVHHAIALGDFDDDGDLDLVVNNLGKAAGIYRNETAAPRVAVRLKGLPPNAQGIGAKIKLLKGAVPVQSQEVICGGRYMAGAEPLLVFAAGKAQGGMTIEVKWRGGQPSVVNGVEANRIYEIEEAGAEPASSKLQAPSSKETPHAQVPTSNSETKPMFEMSAGCFGHVHHAESFEVFDRQPLPPGKLGQVGPGLDADGDGWEAFHFVSSRRALSKARCAGAKSG